MYNGLLGLRLTGAAAVWGCGCLGVYEGTPYLHSLDLTAAPCIQLAFLFIWGYTD